MNRSTNSFFPALILAIAVVPLSCNENDLDLDDGLYAKLSTDKGEIIIKLLPDKAPLTVMNFVGLAEGNLEFANKKGPFYDGLKFHRVIEDFMIQGGDPEGTGSGGPGYRFPDETDNGLIFDKPGLLAMANAGPDTNGSQFFITHVVTDWLNGKHTIFGQVIKSQEVVNSIKQNDVIEKLEILRIGAEASSYKVDGSTFKKIEQGIIQHRQGIEEENREKILNTIANRWPDAKLDEETGIYFVVRREGTGPLPEPGALVEVHYTGTFMDGTKFDSSLDRDEPFQFHVGQGQVIPGWDYSLLRMKQGERRIIVIPPQMAYGERAVGPIPSNSWLVFDVELISF